MERVPIIDNPKLFDAVVAEVQQELANAFPWLDHSFGICERLVKFYDKKKFYTPNIYVGGDEYYQVEPCSEIGNFTFFYLRDPQEFNNVANRIFSPFSLVLWYDTRKVSSPTFTRNREQIKGQIMALLNSLHLKNGRITLNRVYERPENIFSDFSYEHTDNQFLMHPYAGLRIDGVIYTNIPCNL